MFASDIALLIGGPVLICILLYEANRVHKIAVSRRGLFRFPLALLLSTVAVLGTAVLYGNVNPYVIYSYPNAVFFSLSALGFITLYLTLAIAARIRPTPHQTTAVLGELFLLWWIILAIDVKGILVTRAFFFAPFLYMSALAGLAAMLLQSIRPPQLPGQIRLPEDEEEREADNNTTNSVISKRRIRLLEVVRTWDLRKVTIIGITLATQLGFFIVLMVMKLKWVKYQLPRDIMLVDATSALFLVLPFATFMHKLPKTISAFFSLVFIGTFFFSLFVFPFTTRAPAHFEFSQTINLDNNTNVVRISGPKGYTENDVVPHLPSFRASTGLKQCEESPLGLKGQPQSSYCTWHGLSPPSPPASLLTIYQSKTIGDVVKVWIVYAPGCTGYGLTFQEEQPRWEGVSRSEEASGRVTEHFKVWIPDGSPIYTTKASCVWNTVSPRDIPALTEASAFSPSWARVDPDLEGLMIAERYMAL